MIIGLTGPQRAGKTTVMNYLKTRHRFHTMSIADQIKTEAHRLIGRTFQDEEKDQAFDMLGGKTPRDLYIYVGNLDEFNHDLWVNRMLRSSYQGPDELHVIESVGKQFQWTEVVRYAERAGDGAVILDVSRPDHDYRDSRSAIRDNLPILSLKNDGDLANLQGQLDHLISNWSNVVHKRTIEHVRLVEAIERHLKENHDQ